MNIIDLDNQTELPVDVNILEKIALSLSTREIEVILTDNASIAELNAIHRDKNMPTDVLSFPMDTMFMGIASKHHPLGSIVISSDFVQTRSEELGHSINDEFSLLFIHGLLHLLGYDHETDKGEMRAKEKEIIEQFALPSSLIVRTEEF